MEAKLSNVVLKPEAVKSPPGFENEAQVKKSLNRAPSAPQLAEMKVKRAWDIALAPAKSLPMNMFMSYMTGNSLEIIPIMMTFSILINPLKAIFTETNTAFKPLLMKENEQDILLTKVVYVLCQLACAALGVYKLNNMGLIPNNKSDWLAWEKIVEVKEWAGVL